MNPSRFIVTSSLLGAWAVGTSMACTAGDAGTADQTAATSASSTGQSTSASSTSSGSETTTTGSTGTSSTIDPTGFDLPSSTADDSATAGDMPEPKPEAMLVDTLPADFVPAGKGGGYKIVGKLEDLELEASNSCANILKVVVRDFVTSHVDFGERKPEPFMNDGLYLGQLLPDLDPTTRKPSVDPSRMPLDLIEGFGDWYTNTPSVNLPYVMDLWLEPQANGLFLFDSNMFFPLEAPNNEFSVGDEQFSTAGERNFLFTTEIHTAFEYKGTEVFNFRGDDDVWVFINNKLAVDIGGIHGPEVGNVVLAERAAEFGIVPGEVYNLDMFQAERNPNQSNFRIETSLDFKECGVLENDIIR